jgi:H+-transporting ATPase
MRNYCIYRISCTLQLLFFFFFAIVAIDPAAGGYYDFPGMDVRKEAELNPAFANAAAGINATNNCLATHNLAQCAFECRALNVAIVPNFDLKNPKAGPYCPDLANDFAFTLPVISLVIITILNDGTMITIAHDKVIPEKKPQRWAMFEVYVVSCVLEAVACISSLILLAVVLQCNVFRPGGFAGDVFSSGGRNYVQWMEARTIMYLKISISDFLTLFSARTRTWFWERRPGNALSIACLIATGSSTLLALYWDDVLNTEDAYMKGLQYSRGACVITWIYCIIWFVIQDLAKVGTYRLLEKYASEELKPAEAEAVAAPVSGLGLRRTARRLMGAFRAPMSQHSAAPIRRSRASDLRTTSSTKGLVQAWDGSNAW